MPMNILSRPWLEVKENRREKLGEKKSGEKATLTSRLFSYLVSTPARLFNLRISVETLGKVSDIHNFSDY